MENDQNNATYTRASTGQSAGTSVGLTLREARERLGLSVADVTSQIKLAHRQIEALEADDYQSLPEKAFVRGFVRSYAKLLQLDAQPLLDALPGNKPAQEQIMPTSVEVPFPTVQSARVQNFVWLGAAVLFGVLVIGFALWSLDGPSPVVAQGGSAVEVPVALPVQDDAAATPSAQPPAATHDEVVRKAKPELPPVKQQAKPAKQQPPAVAYVKTSELFAQPQAEAAPKPEADASIKPEATVAAFDAVSQPVDAAAAAAAAEASALVVPTALHMVFGEESWTEIKDRDGKVLTSKMHAAGTELNLQGKAPFTMLIGSARAVSLYHQGVQVDLVPYTRGRSGIAKLTVK